MLEARRPEVEDVAEAELPEERRLDVAGVELPEERRLGVVEEELREGQRYPLLVVVGEGVLLVLSSNSSPWSRKRLLRLRWRR